MYKSAPSAEGVRLILSATQGKGPRSSFVVPERARERNTDLALQIAKRLRFICTAFAALQLPLQYVLIYAAVVLGHLTLLRLPYYWDEGGYYIPAALDFFHHGTLIPEFTNAHPPLPNVVLGTVWRLTGFAILPTRLTVCAFAAAALVAVFRLTHRLLHAGAATAVTLLTAVYPIWYAQSSLAHADIFAAAFTLSALALYLPAASLRMEARPPIRVYLGVSALFSLAVLSKETAVVWPATLACLELVRACRSREHTLSKLHVRWFVCVSASALPLLAWFGYHRYKTGFTFGNPEYLRYNATANFSVAHLFLASRYRFLHLFTQRNMWLPLLLAAACFFLRKRHAPKRWSLPAAVLRAIVLLILANWLFFSFLGGALLTRYLLPVYPLVLLLCVAVWQAYSRGGLRFTLLTTAAFVAGWWLSPPTSFAPEDCLSYRDMIVVHQQAIAYIDDHFPNATVLTAWPASTDLFRPSLGYTDRPIKVTQIENFTAPEVAKAAAEPEHFDAALVFATRFTEASLRNRLLAHPNSRRGREYARDRDLTPGEVAARLGGQIVFQAERNGEYAAVLRFPRTYVTGPHPR